MSILALIHGLGVDSSDTFFFGGFMYKGGTYLIDGYIVTSVSLKTMTLSPRNRGRIMLCCRGEKVSTPIF